jgi:hypothetical protein
MIPPFSKFFVLIVCLASVAFADDFKTIDGKEYKNAKVSRVEPDGIVLMTKSGISKVYFTELPKEVQERFSYDAAKATAFSAEHTANQEALHKQRQESERQRVEERERYWSEHPAPQSQQRSSSNLTGSALDRRAFDQSSGSITPGYLVSEYAANEIKAGKQYGGRIFTVSATIKGIFQSEGKVVTVELLVPLTLYAAGDALTLKGKVKHMCCIFNDPGGLEQKQAGNAITLTGRVVGVRGDTLTMEDCHL